MRLAVFDTIWFNHFFRLPILKINLSIFVICHIIKTCMEHSRKISGRGSQIQRRIRIEGFFKQSLLLQGNILLFFLSASADLTPASLLKGWIKISFDVATFVSFVIRVLTQQALHYTRKRVYFVAGRN